MYSQDTQGINALFDTFSAKLLRHLGIQVAQGGPAGSLGVADDSGAAGATSMLETGSALRQSGTGLTLRKTKVLKAGWQAADGSVLAGCPPQGHFLFKELTGLYEILDLIENDVSAYGGEYHN